MITLPPVITQFSRVWQHLSHYRRVLFLVLLAFMVAGAVAEMISIATVLPFISAITNPELIFSHRYATPILRVLHIETSSQLVLLFTGAFCLAAVGAGLIRLAVIWLEERLAFRIGSDFGKDAYSKVLNKSYLEHCNQNSSEIISVLTGKLTLATDFMRHVMLLTRSVVILVVVIAGLLFIDPVTVLLSVGSVTTIYICIATFSRKKLRSVSEISAAKSNEVVRAVQSGLGGIRDVILDKTQGTFLSLFANANNALRRANATANIIGQSPYYIVQAFGIVAIALLAYFLEQKAGNGYDPFALLAMVALAASRLFPVSQQVYRSWASISSNLVALQDVLAILEHPATSQRDDLSDRPIVFEKSIVLKDIEFRYAPGLPAVISGVNLTIKKGAQVGFIGQTGCGKSTMLDLIMGLLPPTRGVIEVDGVPISSSNIGAWYESIAHVPQEVFLVDESVEENIAFGVPRETINHERVQLAASKAQLAETIGRLPNQYQTTIGERGARLSGGQRQRLGIARALYKKADVIVLDEATSALDSETEQAVMRAVESLDPNITVLIVAHRLSTLKNCTSIVKMTSEGISVGTYDEVVASA